MTDTQHRTRCCATVHSNQRIHEISCEIHAQHHPPLTPQIVDCGRNATVRTPARSTVVAPPATYRNNMATESRMLSTVFLSTRLYALQTTCGAWEPFWFSTGENQSLEPKFGSCQTHISDLLVCSRPHHTTVEGAVSSRSCTLCRFFW